MDRPTVHDLAKYARVSLATVDRVLNGRPGVREQTIERVQKAIDELGYSRDANAALLARKKPHRFVFLLPEARTQFLQSLIAAINETATTHSSLRADIEVVQAPMRTPEEAAQTMRTLDADALDGLAIMAPETPSIRDAVIKLRNNGTKVVPIVTDLPNAGCEHFVGVNNIAAGRTAALLLGGFASGTAGSVAVIGGHSMSRDFVERRLGFDEVMQQRFPKLQTLPTIEGFDDAYRVEALARRMLMERSDLVGIYSAAAGTSGLISAMRDHGKTRPVIVAHDSTAATRQGLTDDFLDAVIVQDVGHIARSAVRVLRALKDGLPITAAQERIRIEIFTRENLPDP
ncbi:MAG: LacI family DNA-binding transcriptional regulator [Pseudomonadota bacterium]